MGSNNTIVVESYSTLHKNLTLKFVNWRTRGDGREACDVECNDGTNAVTLTNYSPSPMHSTLEEYADDIIAFINGSSDSEYEDQRQASAWWEDKYMSPLDADE